MPRAMYTKMESATSCKAYQLKAIMTHELNTRTFSMITESSLQFVATILPEYLCSTYVPYAAHVTAVSVKGLGVPSCCQQSMAVMPDKRHNIWMPRLPNNSVVV